MQKEHLVVVLIAAVIVFAVVGGYLQSSLLSQQNRGCTMEAKVCSDGSTVGRTGPNCEFAACPAVSTSTPTSGGGGILPYDSGVRGAVVVGPTCPVERIPPDPACAPKPYATTITAERTGATSAFATTQSDATGTFQLSLPPGDYTISAQGGQTLPRCAPQNVTVGPSGYVTITLTCDTGIR